MFDEDGDIDPKKLGIWAAVIGFAALSAVFVFGSIGYNAAEDWQVHQSVMGSLTVIDRPGYYLNMWGKVSKYPRYVEYYYTARTDRGSPNDESIQVTFNDSGIAQVGVYVKLRTPFEADKRLEFHNVFRGADNNIRDAVEAHMINCLKAAGPLMSSTENQTARKAEFNSIIEGMLQDGLYVMRRQVVEADSVVSNVPNKTTAENVTNKDAKPPAEPIRVLATEVVIDDKTGKPKIASESPLKRYGMLIEQFSVVETAYDPDTLKQFQAKKQAFLLAEQARAEQQRAVQEKLRITAEGESEVEKIKQEGEKEKMKALVSAEKEAEVAEVVKKKAVTEAEQKVEVAGQQLKEAETMKQVAAVEAETAELKKQADISAAEAKAKALDIGGALSEADRLLATLKKERDIGVAEALSKIPTPGVVVSGSGGDGKGASADLQNNLINLTLMRALGVLDTNDSAFQKSARPASAVDSSAVIGKTTSK